MVNLKKGTEVILKLLASFLLIQLLGLYVGMQYVNRDISITENPEDVVNAAMMLVYVISGAVMMLLLIKFYKKRWIF